MCLQNCALRVREREIVMKKTYVVGIAGASASGKSTVSEHLRSLLADYAVQVVHMDEYYREAACRPKIIGITDDVEYVDDNHPAALDIDRCYLDAQNAMGACEILIIEGIFAFWDERVFGMLDLKVFVDCDADERFARRVSRNLSFGQSIEEITNRYVQAVQPRQRAYVEPAKWKADIILNGFSQVSTGVEIVADWVKGRMRGQ